MYGCGFEWDRVRVIDSHTCGEPTRVVIEGGPELGTGTLAERRELFRQRFDSFRSAVINEPRGSDVLVGALLLEPVNPECVAGVIFFNNVGYLNMCGHGTIGVAVTLAYMGWIGRGVYQLETPVGTVSFEYHGANRVTIENVPSYRYRKGVTVEVPGYGLASGDVAWGGNWFFLVAEHGQELALERVEELTRFAWAIRQALPRAGVTGQGGAEIDHIGLFGPPTRPDADARNFVLCPGKAYDRSPCGTGTSAQLACLIADGKLEPGQVWRQESLVGTVFEATARVVEDKVIPRITGTAYVTAEATLLFQRDDPFREGIRA